MDDLWEENRDAWNLYQLLADQVTDLAPMSKKPVYVLNYQSVAFVFDMYIPDYRPENRKAVFEKILLIYSVAQERNGR